MRLVSQEHADKVEKGAERQADGDEVDEAVQSDPGVQAGPLRADEGHQAAGVAGTDEASQAGGGNKKNLAIFLS